MLGPAVFSPMFAGNASSTPDALTVPWLAAAGIALVALVMVMLVRPDTREIATSSWTTATAHAATRRRPRRWPRSSAGPG